jgi:hypothetical protein
VTAEQLRTTPLRALARPAPIRVDSVRVDPDLIVHHPGPGLATRWAPSVARCEVCGAPVRAAVAEVVRAVLGDVDPPSVESDCLWCSPEGIARSLGVPAMRSDLKSPKPY